MATRDFPPAQAHGELRQLFEDVFFVSGTVKMKSPPFAFSRNMTVVRQGGALTLIGSMRLDDEGLRALDDLGKVEHVIRLAAFHGMDDPFYRDRYGATVWAVRGSFYMEGFDPKANASDAYFEPDEWMDEDTKLPIDDATLHVIDTETLAEGMLLLEREGGILISGDCLQNWATTDQYFNLGGKVVMKLMGFIKPCSVGPGWLKGANPNRAAIRDLLELEFSHVLPVHGAEVIGDAREKYRPAIERVTSG